MRALEIARAPDTVAAVGGVDRTFHFLQLWTFEVNAVASRHAIVPSPSVSSHMTVSRERTEVERSVDQTRIRSFTDDLGQTWLVTERPFSEYDRRSGSSLIFSSELAVRRVRDYPSDWYALSDSDLASLSWRV